MAVVVLRLDVGDVENPVAAHRKINERRLNRGFEIHDSAFIDIPGETLVAGALDVKLFEDAVFDDGDTAFLGLEHVDQHFFLHTIVFLAVGRLALSG